MIYHKDGTQPNELEIFVFGSNLAGIHGGGAAKAAFASYGAIWGRYSGLSGRSYAIPTKDENIETLPLQAIKPYISAFVELTHCTPDKRYFVTRIGCVLAGYADSDIAPLFIGANRANCNFPEEWAQYL